MLAGFTLQAQYAVNDYGSAGSGTWGTVAIWNRWNGSAWVAAGSVPAITDNVWILNGHTISLEASPKNCKDLNVEAGGKVYTNVTVNRYINVYGNITCNGIIGNGATFDGIAFNIEGVSCLVSGTGSFDASRIRKSVATNPTTTLTLAMNVNLRFGTSSGTQIYNAVGSASYFHVIVNSGVTLNLTGGAFLGNAAIDGTNGNTAGSAAGSYTVNGTMIVSGIFYMRTSNPAPYAVSCSIGATGLIRAGEVSMNFSGAGAHTLNIASGGKLEITGTNSISTFSTVNNFYNLTAGSTVEYSAAGAQTVRSGLTYSNVIFSGSGAKSTDGNMTVGRDLTISGSAVLTPATNSITIGGNWSNYGTGGFNEATSTVIWNGSNAQSLTTTGGEDFYRMTMNNSSATGLTPNNPLSVSNLLTMTDGLLYTTSVNLLTLNVNASTSGASNASFVTGPVRYLGHNAMVFPVGKNSDYQPLGISAGAAAGGPFWTENFNNGCTSLCLGSAYSGVNGAWTMSNSSPAIACGVPTTPNEWYVSCAENGNAAGACGTGCGANATLHVGNISTSPSAGFFCPTGDCGAAYDAGGLCGGFGVSTSTMTDKRMESPVINCTGYSSITLSFNYIEGGETTNDNATVWYFDGSVWSQLADMAKTPTGTCGTQGTWTNYLITLPASADGNPNVKIGFRWVNDDLSASSDPSFAVDDVVLSVSGPATSFTCEYFYADPHVFGSTLAPTLAQIESCEYWILDRDAGTENKNVTLNWDANSCLAGATVDQRVARFDGSVWQDEGNTGTTGTMAAGSVTSNVVTSFSPFTIGSVPSTLPVQLLTFVVKPIDNSRALLNWETAAEINNDRFEIERSKNGIDFEYIGSVKGCGNCNSQKQYAYTDIYPYEDVSYYRLKQVDYDGEYEYSPTRAIEIANAPTVQLFPNPTNGSELFVNVDKFETNDVSIYVTDIAGKLVVTETVELKNSSGKYRLIFDSKPEAGVYLVTVKSAQKTVSSRLIVN
ncbi:MAG TPA: T9SS type A sorting domain-containing protein [Flavobacteriales bacterium]|nr:T9SS type A sorting domain-containing protein [Flavobacteriales bacterium]